MATYSKGLTQVSYSGYEDQYYSKFYNWYWGFTVTGDVVYGDTSRYLHISSVKISLKVSPKSKYIGTSYLQVIPPNAPGTIIVRFRCITNAGSPSSSIQASKSLSWNAGGSLGNYIMDQSGTIKNYAYSKSFTKSCSVDLPLINSQCYLNLYMTQSGMDVFGEYQYYWVDWGNLTSGTFAAWDPNNPGVQYWTGSKWETHKIKRWNGGAWVDIPGQRYNGSSWAEVKG